MFSAINQFTISIVWSLSNWFQWIMINLNLKIWISSSFIRNQCVKRWLHEADDLILPLSEYKSLLGQLTQHLTKPSHRVAHRVLKKPVFFSKWQMLIWQKCDCSSCPSCIIIILFLLPFNSSWQTACNSAHYWSVAMWSICIQKLSCSHCFAFTSLAYLCVSVHQSLACKHTHCTRSHVTLVLLSLNDGPAATSKSNTTTTWHGPAFCSRPDLQPFSQM